MVADTDLSDRQAKFLQERNKMQQKYEAQSEVQGNYLTAAETEEKKGKSIGVVGGLIIIAFVAPMGSSSTTRGVSKASNIDSSKRAAWDEL